MQRFTRSLGVLTLVFGLHSDLLAQTSNVGSLPLPETYFPGLKSLLDSAAKQSPRMVARNTEEAVAEAGRISARSGLLPTVGGYFSYYPWTRDKRADLPDSTGVKKMAYNFAINQPLFHWGALRDGSRIGELQQKIAQGQTGEAYRLLVDEIRAQYLQVIMTKAAVARARFGLKIAEDQLALARTKLEKRFISEGDLFGPTISAEQARLASDRAAEDYENSRTYLSKLCGTPILSDDQIPSEVPAVTPASSDLQAVVSEFANHGDVDTYALRIARDQIAVEELNYKIADTRLKPKANLNFGTSQDEQNYSLNSVRYKVQSYYAGFVVNWSIFDGFATRAVKTASLARRRQLEETYKIQTADTIAAVRSQLRQVEFSARSLALSERLLGSAGDMLNAKKEDMSRGVASDTDVSLAQLGVYDSQLAAYAARNDYLLRVSRVLSATMKDPALANLSLSRR